jgi:hypothetical protein
MHSKLWSNRPTVGVLKRPEKLPIRQILTTEMLKTCCRAMLGTQYFEKCDIRGRVLVNIEIPLTLQTNYAQDLEH